MGQNADENNRVLPGDGDYVRRAGILVGLPDVLRDASFHTKQDAGKQRGLWVELRFYS